MECVVKMATDRISHQHPLQHPLDLRALRLPLRPLEIHRH
jgi:hypothetical protein